MSVDERPSQFVAQVLFDYLAQASEEITLKEGQFCHVLETNDAGWWLVREANGSRSGWAPSNFLRRLDADEIGLAAGLQAISPVHKRPDKVPSVKRNCQKCKEEIKGNFALAEGKSYHVPCFTCTVCSMGLAGNQYFIKEGSAYCNQHYYERFGQICAACGKTIYGAVVNALDKHWHPEHFACTACKSPIAGAEFFIAADGKPYCANDYQALFGTRCAKCQEFIDGATIEVQGSSYHVSCFQCCVDQVQIDETAEFHIQNGELYCQSHFQARFLNHCQGCNEPLTNQYVQILGKTYHVDCFRCNDCNLILSSGQFQMFEENFLCGPCLQIRRARKARASEMKERIAPVNIAPNTTKPKSITETTRTDVVKDSVPSKPNETVTKTVEQHKEKQNLDLQRDGNGRIRMKAADLVGKDRPLPDEIDRLHKENYLWDDEFQSLFGMGREQFAALKPWKQQQIKQQLGLF